MCFVLFIFCLYICVCECLFQNNNHKTKHKNHTNSGSAQEPGGSGLPYYCTPPVCVPEVLGALAVSSFKQKQNNSGMSPPTLNMHEDVEGLRCAHTPITQVHHRAGCMRATVSPAGMTLPKHGPVVDTVRSYDPF